MLPPRLHQKLSDMDKQLSAIEKQMAEQPQQSSWQSLAEEYGKLLPLTEKFRRWQDIQNKLEELNELQNDNSDPEMAAMAKEEYKTLLVDADNLAIELRRLSSPKMADNTRNCFLEIRAAVGGNESCLFAGDLFRMYFRYAETRRWQTEIISHTDGEMGGYKEVISRIIGTSVYGALRHESGAHRVQRVPDTESQGRIHTSVVTVAIMPEAQPEDNINISPTDLRVETFRSSGAGGQHVNTTDSAVRITHIPTNTVVECQDGRSQHKNREQAMSVLYARIVAQRRREQHEKEAGERRALVGSGDRSDRIRTYNFPQGRMTDHRIGLTLYKLPAIMEGDLDETLTTLAQADDRGMLDE